jgi:hypothetical protein
MIFLPVWARQPRRRHISLFTRLENEPSRRRHVLGDLLRRQDLVLVAEAVQRALAPEHVGDPFAEPGRVVAEDDGAAA